MRFSLAAGEETELTVGPGADGPTVKQRSFVPSRRHPIQTSFSPLGCFTMTPQIYSSGGEKNPTKGCTGDQKKIDLKKVKKPLLNLDRKMFHAKCVLPESP